MIHMNEKLFKHEEFIKLFEDALVSLKSGKALEGQEGAIRPLVKRLLEASLEGEMDIHLQESRPNRRNGKGKKQVKTSMGEVSIETPRDRDGTYTPELIPKRQRSLGPSLENKIISLYSMGMSYRDISNHVDEMYGMELSPSQLTTITDKIWPEIEEWRNRRLWMMPPTCGRTSETMWATVRPGKDCSSARGRAITVCTETTACLGGAGGASDLQAASIRATEHASTPCRRRTATGWKLAGDMRCVQGNRDPRMMHTKCEGNRKKRRIPCPGEKAPTPRLRLAAPRVKTMPVPNCGRRRGDRDCS